MTGCLRGCVTRLGGGRQAPCAASPVPCAPVLHCRKGKHRQHKHREIAQVRLELLGLPARSAHLNHQHRRPLSHQNDRMGAAWARTKVLKAVPAQVDRLY